MKGYLGVLKDAFKKGQNDQMTDRAAAMTYNSLMALFPGLILSVSILGLIGRGETYDAIVEQVRLLPADAEAAIMGILENATENQNGALLSLAISIVVGLNGASGALAAAGRGLNVVLGVKDDRGFVRKKLHDILWTLLLIALTLVSLTLIGSGGAFAEWIFDQIGLGDTALTLWSIARWPLAVAVAIAIFAIVYYVAPDAEERKFRFLSVGAIFGVFVWILASVAFFLYVSNFGNYEAYGAFAGPVILLLWLYLTNIALLLGAELNAVLDEKKHGISHASETESVSRQREEERVSDDEERQEVGESLAPRRSGRSEDRGRDPSTDGDRVARPGRAPVAQATRRDATTDTHGIVQGGNTSTGRALLGLALVGVKGRLRRRKA